MQEDLAAIQNNPARAIYCSQRLLCRTLAGNNVYILTITSPGTTVSLQENTYFVEMYLHEITREWYKHYKTLVYARNLYP